MRISINIPDDLADCCKSDAKALRLSVSAYFRRLAEERHGLSKISTAPPARMGAPGERSDSQSKCSADLAASLMKPRDSEN